jgi:hypothetical protein
LRWLPLAVILAIAAHAQEPRALIDRGAALEEAGRLDDAARVVAERTNDGALLVEALLHLSIARWKTAATTWRRDGDGDRGDVDSRAAAAKINV